jgi:hypothetical protein
VQKQKTFRVINGKMMRTEIKLIKLNLFLNEKALKTSVGWLATFDFQMSVL